MTIIRNASQDSSEPRWCVYGLEGWAGSLSAQTPPMESLAAPEAMPSTTDNNTPETSRERGKSLKGVFGLSSLIGP
ncbi:hypothetical protein BDS110ZK4_52860 [Bradyrhizobium diazoefficiens]|nr:hypothetical protein BDHF08_40570 [Bradyrhizobium diazoefficiens]BCE47728.1 hypothetical protein XF4B_40770 [Bradyrhizobium diazoefficiens]BCE56616.1 hypothetical protein XF5B_41280 [Bradyrhizobium diazoefficiens]